MCIIVHTTVKDEFRHNIDASLEAFFAACESMTLFLDANIMQMKWRKTTWGKCAVTVYGII